MFLSLVHWACINEKTLRKLLEICSLSLEMKFITSNNATMQTICKPELEVLVDHENFYTKYVAYSVFLVFVS
jgi:hypothetical protein